MNDLERNHIIFSKVTINTKFLNCLQPEWLKYVTQVRLVKRLTGDSYDDLFDYLQQFEKLVNASRAKKLEKSHDPLPLVAHMGSSSRTSSRYYVTHPSSVVDYDDDYQGDTGQNNSDDQLTSAMILLARSITRNFSNPTNNRLRTSSNTRNQAIVQGDRVNIQSKNSGNYERNIRRAYVQEEVLENINVQNDAGNIQRTLRSVSSGTVANVQCYNCSEKGHYARNCPKPRVRDSKYFMEQMLLAKQDEAGVILTDEQNDFLFADVSRMEEIKELSANIYLMARIQPTNIDGSSNDSAFLSEVQTPSTSYVNLLFAKDNQEQNGSVKNDNNVQDSYELEQLARNAYKEAEKQQIIAKKVQQQNIMLTKQLELYKEKVRVFEITKEKTTNYFNEYIEADRKVKRFEQESQSQFIRDRDIIRDLENVVELKRQTVELQKTQSILKRKMSENEDKYHDTILDLEAKTRAQTQGEINELIENVKQKTYAYADVRAQNQDLLLTIYELKAKLKTVENGLSATSSVRRPPNMNSSFKNSVISNTKNSSEKVEVSDRANKKPDVASKNVALNKIVTNDEIKNALIEKNVLRVTCAKNVLIPCHDNCLAKYKLNVHSNVRRALFTTPRTVKSMFKDTTPVVSKTRFSVRTIQSKSVDTTPVVSKAKIVTDTFLSAKN
ncbi:retrovirus-related pol polyprotein from transposon TNT 1-94 [Tanacetum coccineum]